jgi:hypothetical protein
MRVAMVPYGVLKRGFMKLSEQLSHSLPDTAGAATEPIPVKELRPENHLVLFASSQAFLADHRGVRCRLSILLREPPIIQRRYYQFLRFFGGKYHRILTHNTWMLQRCPNAVFVPHGGSFLKVPFPSACPKDRLVSLIASRKRTTPGQALRHRIADWATKAELDLSRYGYAYQPLDDKADGHSRYMFSVVIENCREPGYFSEKLIDSLLCESIPIYWGAPDVSHFFDPRGMILCRTEQDIRLALANVSEAEFSRRLPYLLENRKRALRYAHWARPIPEIFRSEELGRSDASPTPLRIAA